jgi:serine/threonine-protein kinase
MTTTIELPGEFTLTARLASGGMGEVWLGCDGQTGDEVAIKVLRSSTARDPELMAALRREVSAAARLDHPNIIEIFDWSVVPADVVDTRGLLNPGSPFIVMEFAGGGSLETLRGVLDAGEITALLRHTLRALAHSHARGVIHRDIKPPNILFAPRDRTTGSWKLGDFGIAQIFDTDVDATDSMRGGVVVGTPPYMAPEQFTALWHDFGPWTDLYAVGVVAWELIHGALPFAGPSLVEFAMQHMREELPTLAPAVSVPPGLVEWVRRSLSKDPALRFRNASEALDALNVIHGIPDDVGPFVPSPAGVGLKRPASLHETFGQSVANNATLLTRGLVDADLAIAPTADRPQPQATLLIVPREFAQPPSTPPRTDDSAPTQNAARIMPRRGATPSALIALRSNAASTPPPSRRMMPADWRGRGARESQNHRHATALFGLRALPTFGRDAERDALWSALRSVVDTGRPAAVLLEGVAGSGKSHLAEWLGELADEMLGCFVLYVQHAERDDVGEALARALTRRLRCIGLRPEDLGAHLAAALRPWGVHNIGELAAARLLTTASSAGVTLPDGNVLRFEQTRERHAALARLLARLSAERPAVVVLDDAQWAADLLMAIRHTVTSADPSPARVLFVAAAQRETLQERGLERAVVEELAASGALRRIPIPPLPRLEAMSLAVDGLGLAPAAAALLVERTGGNPMATVQAFSGWLEAGALTPTDHGLMVSASDALRTEASLTALWSARLERALVGVDERDLIALEVLAALGIHVRLAEAHDTWRRLDVAIDQTTIERLVRASLLTESRGELQFAHPAVRAALELRTRNAGRECELHRACYAMLIERGEPAVGTRARVASHLMACGEVEAAADLLLADAADLTRASDYGNAELRIEEALAVLERIGHGRDTQRARVGLALRADVLRLRWRFDEAEAACHEVLAARTDDIAAQRARATLAKVARQRGRLDEAERIGSALCTELAGSPERDRMADAVLSLAIVARMRGQLDLARARYENAQALFDDLHDALGAAHVRLGLAHLMRMQGDNAHAEALYADARRRFDRVGNRHEAANCLSGAAELARFDGRLVEALAGYRAALALQRAVGARDVTITELNIALVEIARAEYSQARARLVRVSDRMREAGQSGYVPYAGVALLTTYAGLGDRDAWDADAPETFDQLTTSGLVDRDIAEQLEIAARAWTQRHDPARARQAADRASAQRLRLSQPA